MRRHALPILAGLITFITIVTGGVAYALWSTSTSASITAGAASTGIEQSSSMSGSTDYYDEADDVFAHAYEVTITNTGTRDAEYELLAASAAPSDPALPAAIDVRIGTAGTCTPAATLTGAQGGLLSDSPDYAGGPLAPGATVTLCVITEIDAAEMGDLDGAEHELVLTSQLRWSAANPAWTQSAAPATVIQAVTAAPSSGWVPVGDLGDPPPPTPGSDLASWMLVKHPVGRYWLDQAYRDVNGTIIVNGRVCKNGGEERPALYATGACDDGWNSQWRPIPVPGTNLQEWMVLRAINSYTQPETPAWSRSTSVSHVVNEARNASSAAQRWRLETDGQGLFRFVAVDSPAGTPMCLTATTINTWTSGSSALPTFLTTAACDPASTRQTFRMTLSGYPIPGSVLTGGEQVYPNGYALVCTEGGTSNTQLTWTETYASQNHELYTQETLYRLVFRTEDIPSQSTQPVSWFYNSGTWRNFQVASSGGMTSTGHSADHQGNIRSWWDTTYGANGTHRVTVWIEQQITEVGIWTATTAPRELWLVRSAPDRVWVHCDAPPGATPTATASSTPTPTTAPPPAGPLAFPASWCTPSTGNYLHLHFPYASGSTWRVFFWKTGQPAIDPNGSTGRIDVTGSWYDNGQQYLELRPHGQNSLQKWAQDNGGGAQSGVEVRLYRDLGGGNWEYFAMRPMTVRDSGDFVTCA